MNDIKPILGDMPENILEIWNYGFTEMLNNAIDHASGTEVHITVVKTAVTTKLVGQMIQRARLRLIEK